MRNAFFSLSPLFLLFLSLPPCAAQSLIPVIQLTSEESAKAKQLTQSLKDAKERSAKAKVAWEQFHDVYQAAHPDLPNLRFTEDFRLALARANSTIPGVPQLATIELTAEERQKLEALHREMDQSKESEKQAETNWQDFRTQLVLKHVGASTSGSGNYVRLSGSVGGQVLVPDPWSTNLAFTPDFRLATPELSFH